MSSPLPPDPYTALGVPKDADLAQIRTAHRKLVLKYHPDRIRGDDVAEKNKAKDEFQRVQQAYELLSEPSKRDRYDAQVRLAELQKEKMMRETTRPKPTTTQTTPAPTFVRRDLRSDGHYYEERVPPTSYFDDRDTFDEPLPRASARKHEAPYEKEKKSPAPKPSEKWEKLATKMMNPTESISKKTQDGLRAAAARARDRDRARDGHAKSQEVRDREKRHNRSEKHSSTRTVEVVSDSDSDTPVPTHTQRSRRSSPHPKQEPEPIRVRPFAEKPRARDQDDDSYDEDEKWERHYKNSYDYIAESQKRPTLSRNNSEAYVYWNGDAPAGGRRSGSDSEKRSAKPRRTKADEARPHPKMPVHSSAPGNLRPFVEERTPQRSKTNPYPEREPRPVPGLNRSQTMPINKGLKKEAAAPARSSNLKHSETQDSGYYSSSNPHTPEMKGDSPPPSRENSKKKPGSTKYTIVTPDDDDDRASHVRILDSDDEKRPRRQRSPEPEKRERYTDRERDRADRERPRPQRVETDIRPRAARVPAPTSFPRSEFRQDGPLPRSAPVNRAKLFGEISPEDKESPYSYHYDPSRVKTAAYRPPVTTSYTSTPRHREAEEDYAPGSTFRETVRHPHARRPSAAY